MSWTTNRWRFDAVLALACTSLSASGCGIVEYPESFAAPEFEVYRLTTDAFPDWWQCSFERPGTICEATITRNNDDKYIVELAVSSDHPYSYDSLSPELVAELMQDENALFELTYLPPRDLTVQEVARMKALFGDLRINRNPPQPPFAMVCCNGVRLLRVHRWDDVQLGTHTFGGTLIDYWDSVAIVAFLAESCPLTDSHDETMGTESGVRSFYNSRCLGGPDSGVSNLEP